MPLSSGSIQLLLEREHLSVCVCIRTRADHKQLQWESVVISLFLYVRMWMVSL